MFVATTGTEHDAVYESHATLAGLRASVAGYVLTRAPGGRRYRAYGQGT